MRYTRAWTTLVIGGLTIGCSSSTGSNGTTTATANDPAADTFGAGSVQWDISQLKVVRDTGGVTVTVSFAANVIDPLGGDPNAVIGAVDFDVDQNVATGGTSVTDANRPDVATTSMGMDYFIDLGSLGTGDLAAVVDFNGNAMGDVHVTYAGKTISFRIPRAMFGGDDAFLNAAAIFGSTAEPTDLVPNNGHLKVGGTGADSYSPLSSVRSTTVRRIWPRTVARRADPRVPR